MGNIIGYDLQEKTKKHPCYDSKAHDQYSRMHLPIAPACNIQCNYCNRKFDCVNESRPGVTSSVLSPKEALERYEEVKEKMECLSVVGIAGPGDALANWDKVKDTLEKIREKDSEIVFCLSTNGLRLPEFADELLELGISHITVTVNAVDPDVGKDIYRYVMFNGKRYEGVEAATLLLSKQLEGIKKMVKGGALVKINTVMMEGINDHHIPEIVKKMQELGAFIGNIMPLIPAPGSAFEDHSEICMKKVEKMREDCQPDLKQMKHCRQCRADAIGKLDQDRSAEFSKKIV